MSSIIEIFNKESIRMKFALIIIIIILFIAILYLYNYRKQVRSITEQLKFIISHDTNKIIFCNMKDKK